VGGVRGRLAALEAKIAWRPKGPFHCFAIDIESAAYRIFGAGAGGRVRALVWQAGAATIESEHAHEA
jgi:hypothetical protein